MKWVEMTVAAETYRESGEAHGIDKYEDAINELVLITDPMRKRDK